jgi:uncharacterized membrane protein (DUF373 family)
MSKPPAPSQSNDRFARVVRGSLAGVEEIVYVIVGLLLLVAAVLIVVGAVYDVETAIRKNTGAVDIAVTLLDRILLALIVAELLHTLRYVVLRGEIVAEPFLFVGLIAVVRRILIVTASLESQKLTSTALTNELLELGLLGLLALALALAIYLVRKSGENSGSNLAEQITGTAPTVGL